jgi:hypothetical protein
VWEITGEEEFTDMPPIHGYKAQRMAQRQSSLLLPTVRFFCLSKPLDFAPDIG